MSALLIGVGNRFRRDDAVAHAVLEQFPDIESRSLFQLTAEVAADLVGHERVLFVDADLAAAEVAIQPVEERTCLSALTHVASPGDIVALSRALYGFSGDAFVCKIPAHDLAAGEGLSPECNLSARRAVTLLGQMLAAQSDQTQEITVLDGHN